MDDFEAAGINTVGLNELLDMAANLCQNLEQEGDITAEDIEAVSQVVG